MKKEIIICTIIVISIVILNFVTGNYTKNTLENLKSELYEIKELLDKENEEEIKEKIIAVKKDWKKRSNILSYYIEHDEIEKVDLYLVGLESNTNEKEYSEATSELDKCVFILEHIEEKYSFDLKNIF